MPNQNLTPHGFKHCIIALALLLFATVTIANDKSDIEIEFASLLLQNETYFLDTQINYHLSKQAIEAINNGVTLTFNVDFFAHKPRKWLWDEELLEARFPYQLKYHTFAKTYQVIDLTTHLQLNFSSLEAALSSLGSLSELPIDNLPVYNGFTPNFTLQAYLHIQSLPLPMRPLAYITPGWYLRSDLYRWHLNP